MKQLLLIHLFFMLTIVAFGQWQGDTNKFQVFEDSVQLNDVDKGNARLSQLSNIIEDATWEFSVNIKQGTSSSNYACFYIVSSNATLDGNGYFVKIGGTSDEVSLYRQDGSSTDEIIDGLDKRIDTLPMQVRVKVTRTAGGKWTLYSKLNESGEYVKEGEIIDYTYYSCTYLGLKAVYTKTRAKETTFYNFMFTGNAFTDNRIPHLDSIRLKTSTTASLYFDEAIIVNSITNNGVEFQSYSAVDNVVHVVFSNEFNDADTSVIKASIGDTVGNVMDTVIHLFYEKLRVKSASMLSADILTFKLSKSVSHIDLSSLRLDGYSPISLYYKDGVYVATFDQKIESKVAAILEIDNISDIYGDFLLPFSQEIYYFIPEFGDVVINEIMCDPRPLVGNLPEVEYLELFNTTSYDINLASWSLIANDKISEFSPQILRAFSYVIIGSSANMDEFSEEKSTLSLSGFPTLNNTTMSLQLMDNQDRLIDLVTYDKSWHLDDFKGNGGFSLERIDNYNLSQIDNWTSSCSTVGGTPGELNCSTADNPDAIPPYIEYACALDSTSMIITFSELVKSEYLEDEKNYELSEGIEIKEMAVDYGTMCKTITIMLNKPMEKGQVYELKLSGIYDLNGLLMQESTLKIALCHEPAKGDIVINELMFDPLSDEMEYIEIFNNSEHPYNLNDLIVTKDDNEGGWANGKNVGENNELVLPFEYLVLTPESAILIEQYNIAMDNVIELSSMPTLSNEEDHIALLLKNGDVIDDVHYFSDWHSPLVNNTKGVAIERLDADGESNLSSNWFSASGLSNFGTPGSLNSQRVNANVSDQNAFELSPEIISPDGDGIDDFLRLYIDARYEGGSVRVVIFNRRGQEIRELESNALIGTQSSLRWDGTAEDGTRCAMGPYMFWIEVVMPTGKVITEKLDAVVSSRLN